VQSAVLVFVQTDQYKSYFMEGSALSSSWIPQMFPHNYDTEYLFSYLCLLNFVYFWYSIYRLDKMGFISCKGFQAFGVSTIPTYIMSYCVSIDIKNFKLVHSVVLESHSDTSLKVELLWMSDQLITETSPWLHTTPTADKTYLLQRNSNQQSQQTNGCRITP